MTPTGRQLELRAGSSSAVVVQLGAALRTFAVDGRDLVQGFAEDEPLTAGRGQHCLPWPNRVRDGKWSWQGEELELPVNEPARGAALHGLARWQPWEVVEHSASSAVLRTAVLPQTGWPGTLEVQTTWTLYDGRLVCEVRAANAGAGPCPFGYAAHPYLACGTATIDEATLVLPARSQVLVDPERLLPTGMGECSPEARSLAGVQLDTCFGDLQHDRAAVLAPDGTGVELVADRSVFPWRQVYTGDDLPEVAQRRTALALEPMTCPPDALRTGEDLVVLEPGQAWEGAWELRAVG